MLFLYVGSIDQKQAAKQMKQIVLSFIFLITNNLQAQTYRNLVLEGGGIRGVAYCGALEELERQGVLQHIKRVGGTSAGAIHASMLALGFSGTEITELVNNVKFESFNDGRYIFIGGISRTINRYGWYQGKRFTHWIEKRIETKTGNKNLTLGQLHDLVLSGIGRDLFVMATNLSQQRSVVLSYQTYPNMRVADAVRASMSIPLYYNAVFVDSFGRVYDRPQIDIKTDVLVDGGVTLNYPITIFDQNQFLSTPDSTRQSDAIVLNPETLGLSLDRSEQIRLNTTNGEGVAPYPIDGFTDYVSAFYNLIMEKVNYRNFNPENLKRTISIDYKNISQRVRKLSPTEKATMMDSGREAVKGFRFGN
jgi:NTE family protein